MSVLQRKIKTKIGDIYLVASKHGLKGVHWKKQILSKSDTSESVKPIDEILDQAEVQLMEYFLGKRKKFQLKMDLSGTDFQRKVWLELQKIPYGRTLSYKEIASQLNGSKAYRAVGSANGRNPLSIIIPCHRVIAASGKLGGYAGGLKIKTMLLELENSKFIKLMIT